MSSTAAQDQDAQDALSYELLLTKFSKEQGCGWKVLSSGSSLGDASTVEPEADSSEDSAAAARVVVSLAFRAAAMPRKSTAQVLVALAVQAAATKQVKCLEDDAVVAVVAVSPAIQSAAPNHQLAGQATAESSGGRRPEAPAAAKGSAAAAPAKTSTTVLHNVSVNGPSLDCRLKGLLKEVQSLSEGAFSEDCLPDITKKSKWQLSLLASSDQANLYGFIVTKITNGCLSIAKLAIAPELRGNGLGRHFMEEVMKAAKKRGDVYEVCLSSRAEAEKFYQRLGFKADRNIRPKVDFDIEEGQVYMEKKLRQRPRRQK